VKNDGRGIRTETEYEPDFIVETKTAKYLCEPKRASKMQDQIVLAKAKAASEWCKHATEYEKQNSGKPWKYLLISHDVISENMTLLGFEQTQALFWQPILVPAKPPWSAFMLFRLPIT